MARQIYRQSLLERMSSPEQLDKMIVITSPSFWLALLGGAIIVVVTLLWSIFGRLPIKLEASGIFISDQKAYTLASDIGGIVASLEVAVGDQVEEGDVLLTLAKDGLQKELDDLMARREKVEAVTLTSTDDVVTADNRDLINLKTQLDTVDAESEKNRAVLAVYQKELSTLRPKVAAAKKKMEAARDEYYAYITSHANSEIEIAFSEAQARYNQQMPGLAANLAAALEAKRPYENQASSVKSAALSSIDAAMAAPQATVDTWQRLNTEKEEAAAQLAQLEQSKLDMEARLAELQEALNDTTLTEQQIGEIQAEIDRLNQSLTTVPGDISAASADLETKTNAANAAYEGVPAAQAALEELNGLKTAVNGLASSASPESFSFLGEHLDTAGYAALYDLYPAYQSAQSAYTQADAAVKAAEKAYQDAKDAYTAYADGRSESDARKERLANLYNQYNSDYNGLYSSQNNLEANITSIEAQLNAAYVGSSVQGGSYTEQFASTRAAILSSLDTEIEKYQYNLEKSKIRATVAGSVTDIKVGVGAAVGQGSEIVTIRQLADEDCIVCYIPITSGKKVFPGMEVVVTPTTVNRQEYGHMKAEVVKVDDYITSASSIRGTLGDDTLTQVFSQSGPVIAVTCRLYTDDTTASGYWWSSRKGSEVVLPDGTLVVVDVVTEEKAPITMLIPYIKDKLTMAVKPGADAEGEGR